MSFPVTAQVPLGYQWENIDASLTEELKRADTRPSTQISDQYAWLLQVTSWSYGLDWNPKEGTITLELPFSGPLAGLDTSYDKADYDLSITQDEITLIMRKCLEKVHLKRLLAQFRRVGPDGKPVGY